MARSVNAITFELALFFCRARIPRVVTICHWHSRQRHTRVAHTHPIYLLWHARAVSYRRFSRYAAEISNFPNALDLMHDHDSLATTGCTRGFANVPNLVNSVHARPRAFARHDRCLSSNRLITRSFGGAWPWAFARYGQCLSHI